jgi:hypothetical protein
MMKSDDVYEAIRDKMSHHPDWNFRQLAQAFGLSQQKLQALFPQARAVFSESKRKAADQWKHILFVEGAGQALSAKGYMHGPISITPKGIAAYDQLMASGWRPKRKLVRRVLKDDKGVPTAQLDMMTDLIMSVVEGI